MVIRNNGSIADKLVKVETDAAKTVETHTVIKEGDVMKMRPVPGIDVPANGQVKLEPGGFHVMMMDLTRKLNVGDKVKLTLFFERAGQVQLDVTVRAP
jgi:copper(I)-binding protein